MSGVPVLCDSLANGCVEGDEYALFLKCWIKDDKDYEIYQEGELSQILPIAELIEQLEFAEGTVILCGTIPAIGGVRVAKIYHMILLDTVKD